MRRELTRMKVEQAVRGGVKVTQAEVEHAFVLRREEARAAWALVEFGPLIAAASASDDELGKYLGAHQDEFRQPERRRILSVRSEEHTSELQSQSNLVCRLLLEKKKKNNWRLTSTVHRRLRELDAGSHVA